LEIQRVSAVNQDDLSIDELRFSPKGVVATWKSHQKACQYFLDSGDEFGLILEDDFKLKRSYEVPRIEKLINSGVDFLQIGYLRVTFWEGLDVTAYNLRNFALRSIEILSRFNTKHGIRSKRLVSELVGKPLNWVAADIRPGGHGYIVSRKFAESMQELNTPTCISSDGFYEALGKSRAFSMYRLSVSQISQTSSPSSVEKRFNS
jgi:GR25 family glycosyltransferase involved in LPS biosynthesis